MANDLILRAGRLGSFNIDCIANATARGSVRPSRWVRQLAEWKGRWETERQRERDAELGRLVRALLALGGMVCRLDADDGPLYVIELYGETPNGETPLLIGARDPETGLRETLARVNSVPDFLSLDTPPALPQSPGDQ